jgi:hypothetical protein
MVTPQPPLPARSAPGLPSIFAPAARGPFDRSPLRLRIPARPGVLVPLYGSFATLQALDYHSTTRALDKGIGREANPLARAIVKKRPVFIAAKAAATVGIVFAAERIRKKHPKRAVIFMVAANAAMAAVVAHNYSVGR